MSEERRNWTREETIVAFNLYCKIPFNEVTKTNPLVVKFATKISRTPSALGMKISNLARLDPELQKRGISGLVNGSKLDEEIWTEFNGNWDRLAFESETILAKLQGLSLADTVTDKNPSEYTQLPVGTDKQTVVKVRINQAFFRAAVLTAYKNKCCITGLTVTQLLVASHIIPWAENTDLRTDPRNGLLLNSIHDKAFDSGLITITTDYKVKISAQLRGLADEHIAKWFIAYEGKQITLPEKFSPSQEYLRWHNVNIFKG